MTQAGVSYAVQSVNEELQSIAPKPKNSSHKILNFVTWNIDGLDRKNIELRTTAVCNAIKTENVDIAFLQEVVPKTKGQIRAQLPGYKLLCGDDEDRYFTVILLKIQSIWYQDHEVIEFPSTHMGRNMLTANVKFGDKNLLLINSHLESTGPGARERKSQLRSVFNLMGKTDKSYSIIFAGDLNLRERELTELGGVPKGIQDVWVSCGQREECSYTWDMLRNDNMVWNKSRIKPRARYDRVYLKSEADKLKATYFGLIGLERLQPQQCFPSDHWGVLCHFSASD